MTIIALCITLAVVLFGGFRWNGPVGLIVRLIFLICCMIVLGLMFN